MDGRRPVHAPRRRRCPAGPEPVRTDLFVVASGIDRTAVAGAIPPDCLREVAPASPPVRAGRDTLLETGPWRPRSGARHLLPAFSAISAIDYSVRFELSVLTPDGWSPWTTSETLGPASFSPLPDRAAGVQVDVDVFTPGTATRPRLRPRATVARFEREAVLALVDLRQSCAARLRRDVEDAAARCVDLADALPADPLSPRLRALAAAADAHFQPDHEPPGPIQLLHPAWSLTLAEMLSGEPGLVGFGS